MDRTAHDMANLFAQLGQASDPVSIDQFIKSHGPLPNTTPLNEASFWTPAQASFLREAISDDGDWADVVDKLNLQLHSTH